MKIWSFISMLFITASIHVILFSPPNFFEHLSSSPEVIFKTIFAFMILYFFIFNILATAFSTSKSYLVVGMIAQVIRLT